MNIRVDAILLGIILLAVFSTVFADTATVRFSGQEGGRLSAFTVDGPWILDWSTRSEFPMLANFEMRLYDGANGKFIGTVTQLEGTGHGLKLFEDAGTYQLEIVAGNVNWEIEISEVGRDEARKMTRKAEGKPSLRDSSEQVVRRVRESSFVEWRAVDDETLLLFSDDGIRWRVSFSPECQGLESATVISFVAPVINNDDQYDSILLDDGTRCYFHRVSPATGE